MSDYAKKLQTIQQQRQKLIDTESRLIEKRKKEFADLGEQFDLLIIDDKLLSTFFQEFKECKDSKKFKKSHCLENLPHEHRQETIPNPSKALPS